MIPLRRTRRGDRLAGAGLCLALAALVPAQEARALAFDAPGYEARSGRDAGGGRVTITVTDRPLGHILTLLRRRSGFNIEPMDESLNDLRITVHLENVYWRAALDTIARKYKLNINESSIRYRVLLIEKPKLITMKFPDAPVRKVITMIAEQAGANVVIGASVSGTITLNLTNVPWHDALDIVARAAGCVLVTEKRDVIRIVKPEELIAQMETRVFQLAYLQAGTSPYKAKIRSEIAERVRQKEGQEGQMSLKEVLEKVKSESGTVALLQGTNSLIVTDTSKKLEVMESLINELDRPPKQVHLSLKLIELSDSDAEELGILWQNGITGSVSGMGFPTMFPFGSGPQNDSLAGTWPGNTGVLMPKDGRPVGLASPTWVAEEGVGNISLGTLDFTSLTALLKIIRTQTRGRIIQSPQLTVLDHEEATIHVGRLVRYAESFQSTTEGGGQASGFREAANSPVRLGIQVLVIPHVTGPDNNVILTVIPQTESPQSAVLFEVFDGGPLGQLKLPQTKQRTVVTKMMLRDRETGIIAGLRQQSFGETITKIPFLGDLPIIGWLFKHRSRPAETNENSTLLILVTPTVIDFEKKIDIEDQMRAAQDLLGRGFSLRDEALPELAPAGAPRP